MPFVLVTPPVMEPVSLEEAKTHMRVESYDDDAYIETLIAAARQHAEEVMGRALVAQTWDLFADDFPSGALELGKGNLQSVTSVTYLDSDGATQTLDPSKYLVDSARVPGRILPAYGETWPATRAQVNAIRVRFVAGYGSASAVPADIRQAILLLAAHYYENREMVIASNIIISPVPFTFDALIAKHRLW